VGIDYNDDDEGGEYGRMFWLAFDGGQFSVFARPRPRQKHAELTPLAAGGSSGFVLVLVVVVALDLVLRGIEHENDDDDDETRCP
jgi:hypothetical protein